MLKSPENNISSPIEEKNDKIESIENELNEKQIEQMLDAIVARGKRKTNHDSSKHTDTITQTYSDAQEKIFIKRETTQYFTKQNEFDAMGTELIVEENGNTVFRSAGGEVQINVNGPWIEKIKKIKQLLSYDWYDPSAGQESIDDWKKEDEKKLNELRKKLK